MVLRIICLSLCRVQRTKDNLSLSIVLNSCFMAVIGLNHVGAICVGKKTRSIRSKLHLTKIFVTGVAGGLEEAVLAC